MTFATDVVDEAADAELRAAFAKADTALTNAFPASAMEEVGMALAAVDARARSAQASTLPRGASRARHVRRAPSSRRSGSATRSRSPDGPRREEDPEPPLARVCEVCDAPLEGKRRHARTCSTRCRVALHRREHSRLTAAEKAALEQRYTAALRIVRQFDRGGRIDLLGAVVWPTDERLDTRSLTKAAA
jgi:hypothetical protein